MSAPTQTHLGSIIMTIHGPIHIQQHPAYQAALDWVITWGIFGNWFLFAQANEACRAIASAPWPKNGPGVISTITIQEPM